MPADDILAGLKARSLEGVMFHGRMREYFLYLGLRGYAAMHSFHETEERLGAEKLTDYFMAQNGSLIPEKSVAAPDVIPAQWYRMRRQDTDAQWRHRAVRDGMTAWRDWEKSTAVSLKDMIFRLSSENEYGCCRLAEQKLSDVESEISGAEDMIFDLESIEYNLPTIIGRQPSLAECYHSKIAALLTPVSSVTDS
nr:MAG TPA: hypothetical protein [Caudoviricetes sp.]